MDKNAKKFIIGLVVVVVIAHVGQAMGLWDILPYMHEGPQK